MRKNTSEMIHVTLDFDHRELIGDGKGDFIIRWFDNETKIITTDRIAFAVMNLSQALNDVAVLKALNPFIKNINLKVL
tara:strand:- start:12257 stop:12490 length:234 start_codon:yes stop_codon:yes gene_type:complete